MSWMMKRLAKRMGTAASAAPAKPAVVESEEKSDNPGYTYNKREGVYVCRFCGKKLQTEQGMLNHVADKHADED
jgi:peptide methionine sulfoxide reductase MsrB